jgi:hypothetical protein
VVTDDDLLKRISEIFTIAGKYKGLCDWRPGSPTPGHWGMFDAQID